MLPVIIMSCEGPQGPAGIDGADGNANVKAYVFNNLNWSVQNGEATVSRQLSALTSDIMATGAVLTYASYVAPNGSEVQWLLPWTEVEGTYQENLLMAYSTGSWQLTNSASDDVPSIYLNVPKVKVVVIQGLSGKQSGIEPNLSWEQLLKRYPNLEVIEMN